MLARSVDTSRKYVDGIGLNNVITDAGNFILINNTVRGLDRNDRIGSAEQAFSVQVRIRLTAQVPDPAITPAWVRIILFRWKTPRGVAPFNQSILQANQSGAELVISPYQLDTRGQYQIYYDRVVSMQSNSPSQGVFIKIYRKLNFKVWHTINNNANDIQSIVSNALYLYTVSNQVTGGLQASIDLFTRYRFTG